MWCDWPRLGINTYYVSKHGETDSIYLLSVWEPDTTDYLLVADMDDWVVALILLAISLVLVGAMVLLCRILGVWRLTSLFTSGEEKTSLTKAQGQNGYVVNDLKC